MNNSNVGHQPHKTQEEEGLYAYVFEYEGWVGLLVSVGASALTGGALNFIVAQITAVLPAYIHIHTHKTYMLTELCVRSLSSIQILNQFMSYTADIIEMKL